MIETVGNGKKLTDAVMYCTGKDMLPVHTVEKEGFC